MSKKCIVTDSSAQFPKPIFAGKNDVYVIDLQCHLFDQVYSSNFDYDLKILPKYANDHLRPTLHSPTVDYFKNYFSNLCTKYDDIICIFISSYLNKCYENALEASKSIRGSKKIHIFDSKTTSIGLGCLVQKVSELIYDRNNLEIIKQKIRYIIPHIYAIFCISGSSYLFYNNYIDYAQSFVCELLNLYPVFTIEDGKLNPMEKVHSTRQMIELFQEFIEEFEYLTYISLVKSPNYNCSSSKLIREYTQNNFPTTNFTEHILNFPLTTIFGPYSYGLFVVEDY